ncbi:transglycosylase domain-containing protein [Streptomyces erythrochromogenes]|uniref:transglycosylase domain-containing protein n=1 Tax=Streptomyces erythrochromogenes TaxID=285574 RepID=UPI003444B683
MTDGTPPTRLGGRLRLRRSGPAAGPARPRRRPPRTGWRRWIPTWRWTLGLSLGGLLLAIGAVVICYMLVNVPDANALATAQSNVYLYEDGSVLARTGELNRQNVDISQIPKTTQEAVLAAEDRGFFHEPAVNPMAMLRAGLRMATGGATQSGSTITQQYVKNAYLGQEQTLSRKAKELIIAVKLGREQSKQSILEGYLNTSYLGRGAYGIQAAARAYYGKDASQLTTAEGAYLATLLNAPSALDVGADPGARPRALARWNYVLDGMVKEGWLSPEERAGMAFPEPIAPKPASGLSGQRGYLVEAANQYLISHHVLTSQELARGGYRITTTIDPKREDDFVKAVDQNVNSKLSPKNEADRNVRVGGASIDPATGNVVALYGGIDYAKQYVNNATRHDFTPGSTFKPLVLASALDNRSRTQSGRLITPETVYNGNSETPVEGSSVPYAPKNEDDVDYGPITVRTATDKSVNSVYAQMAVDVGPGKVKETAVAAGIPADTPEFSATPSLALGVMGANVIDMAQAYATLADHGTHTPYTLVTSVDRSGHEVKLPSRDPERAVSRQAADTVTSVLRGTVANGTARAAQGIGREAAAKTGTAELDRAALFAGYTPHLATVVSIMGQDPDSGQLRSLYGALGQKRVNGGGTPGQVWAAYTEAALKGTAPAAFDLEPMPAPAPTPSNTPTPSATSTTPRHERTPATTPPPATHTPPPPTTPPPTTPPATTPTPTPTPSPTSTSPFDGRPGWPPDRGGNDRGGDHG